MADNFHFDLVGVPLDLCLQIATLHHKAIGWKEQVRARGGEWGQKYEPGAQIDVRMVLYWSDQNVKDLNRFPAVMGPDELETIIRAWLSERHYGPQPDHDGDNDKGWRVYNEGWTHVSGEWQAFAAVEPVWLMYGK